MPLRESDLFPPLKAWLEAGGYIVHAEVNHCDIAARKGGDLVIVEMKRAINLDLLIQAVRRQTTHASVYVAVPRPPLEDRRWRDLIRLLKRLELGLLVVDAESVIAPVELRFHPMESARRRDSGATRALLTEMSQRSLNLNTGGSTRRPVMTAYREQSLAVAAALAETGPAAPRDLRRLGTCGKTGSILLNNHYGWFERLGVGRYALTESGRKALGDYPELTALLRKRLQDSQTAHTSAG